LYPAPLVVVVLDSPGGAAADAAAAAADGLFRNFNDEVIAAARPNSQQKNN